MHIGSTIRINKIYTIDKKNVKVKGQDQDQSQKSELGWSNIDILLFFNHFECYWSHVKCMNVMDALCGNLEIVARQHKFPSNNC